MSKSTITVTREFDGYFVKVVAVYNESHDGWDCTSYARHGKRLNHRNPYETGNDVWATIQDMIDLEIEDQKSEHAFNAGPFSTAQSEG